MGKKPISLEDVRRNPRLRAQFIKEHPESAEAGRFEKLVEVAAKEYSKFTPRRRQFWLNLLPDVIGSLGR